MLSDPGFAIVNTEKVVGKSGLGKQFRMETWARQSETLFGGSTNFTRFSLTFVLYLEVLQSFRSSYVEWALTVLSALQNWV